MTDNEIIDAFGGSAALARLVGVKSPSVSYWRRKGIPELRKLQLKTLRPELFDDVQTVQQPAEK